MTRLSSLADGAQATVVGIDGTDEISVRLMEMGVLPGTSIKLLGRAPLGDPIELELRGYHLSVRRSEADRVQVEAS